MRPGIPGAFFTQKTSIMERVMHMKKVLIVILALILLLGGLFFWKGGHHAIALSEMVEEWLDEDTADQSLTLMVSIPGVRVDGKGTARPHIQQYSLNADTFWTEYADQTLFGLTAEGLTAWTDGKNLYMDTGKAYALPQLQQWRKELRKLSVGMLLHGRVTKHGDTYNLTMKSGELELEMDITADTRVQSVILIMVLPDDTAVHLAITTKAAASHPVPREISDAMVRSKMEPPMALTEPLEILLPAVESMIPLTGELKLGVDCGILSISDAGTLHITQEQMVLKRRDTELTFPMQDVQPLPAALLLLRHGDFSIDGQDAAVTVLLPPETTAALCTALVPQIADMGMTFPESRATLTIVGGKVTGADLRVEAEVPFLVTTIPLTFTAELNIQ